MRRWLTVLLLVLLPLQFSWAAVAEYCQHGNAGAAPHVGHHDHAAHAHGPAAGDAQSKAKTASSAAAHFDCGHCHGQCAVVPQVPAPLEPQLARRAPPVRGDAPCAEHLPAQPERPQWPRLA